MGGPQPVPEDTHCLRGAPAVAEHDAQALTGEAPLERARSRGEDGLGATPGFLGTVEGEVEQILHGCLGVGDGMLYEGRGAPLR